MLLYVGHLILLQEGQPHLESIVCDVLVPEGVAQRQRSTKEYYRLDEARQGARQGVRGQPNIQRQEGQERRDIEVDELRATHDVEPVHDR